MHLDHLEEEKKIFLELFVKGTPKVSKNKFLSQHPHYTNCSFRDNWNTSFTASAQGICGVTITVVYTIYWIF
jgi:hypothetical protein